MTSDRTPDDNDASGHDGRQAAAQDRMAGLMPADADARAAMADEPVPASEEHLETLQQVQAAYL